MVLFTASRGDTFVGGTCALPSALLVAFHSKGLKMLIHSARGLRPGGFSQGGNVCCGVISHDRCKLLALPLHLRCSDGECLTAGKCLRNVRQIASTSPCTLTPDVAGADAGPDECYDAGRWRGVTSTIIEHRLRLRLTINAARQRRFAPTSSPQPDPARNFPGASDIVSNRRQAIVATTTNVISW